MLQGVSELKGLLSYRGQRYLLLSVVLLFSHRTPCVFAQDLPAVESTQQTNDRIRSLATPPANSSTHDYSIGSGDLLNISVFDVPELSRDVRVNQSGSISIPLVPTRVHVAGLTEIQAQQVIADILQADGLVSHPEVSVLVKEHKSRPITIVGAVVHPMVYDADQSVTLLEALAEAGGITSDAGDTIIITHPRPAFVMIPNTEPASTPAPGSADSEPVPSQAPGNGPTDPKSNSNPSQFSAAQDADKTEALLSATTNSQTPTVPSPLGNIITVNLNELLEHGVTQNNIRLQPGDIVTVPHAGIVYVLGAVNRPGGFVLSNDRTEMTTMKVLALAGGTTKIAKLDHAVIIRKDNQGKQTETEVDLKKVLRQQTEDLPMRASDVLYIPDDRVKEILLQALQTSLAVATAVVIYRAGGY
jgi:polysaccharide biosynthesis/export protein